jgi:hypothetical protein
MTKNGATRVRDSRGRFLKPTRHVDDETRSGQRSAQSAGPKDVEQHDLMALVLLSLALVLGFLGFWVRVAWIASIIAMAALWGVLISRRPKDRPRGVVPEIVTAVVQEIGDVTEAATSSDGKPRPRRDS